MVHEVGAKENLTDPDIAKITGVWPELPEHIKTAIKILVQSHKTEVE